MQSGELVIIGENKAFIHLNGLPSKVTCKFKHECSELVPCNPGDADFLEFEVCHHKHTFTLKIQWKVSGVREVIWHVYY